MTASVGRPLVALVRPWRGRLVLVGLGVLAAAVLDVVPPLVMSRVVDTLVAGDVTGLPLAAVLYLLALSAAQVLTAGYGYLASSVAQRVLAALRGDVFGHLLALPTEYHDRTPVGDAVARATADVETIDDLFSSGLVTLLGETVRLVTVAVTMVLLSPLLSGAVALVIPPLVGLTLVMRRRIRSAERATRIAVAAATAQLQEDLAGADVIRAFGRRTEFARRFRDVLTSWLAAGNASTRANAFYAPALAVLSATATAALLWLGAGGVAHAVGISLGTLTAFVLLLSRFFGPLVNLGDEWQSVQSALAGAERVVTLLGVPVERPSTIDRPAEPSGRPIDLHRVEFGYDVGHPVLHGVTLSVGPGEHVALVGPSGAGKSTVIALLAGLYRPTGGSVRLAGHDPARLADDQRRGVLGVVPQAVQHFAGTVRDNITLGDESIGPERVTAACLIAGIDPYIRGLPHGYDTMVSDTGRGEGVVLSAGQRQLLALARALANRPRVLLLDEATSVVDAAADAAFRLALRERVLPSGCAVLTVAHRLATARDADRVVVLDRGRVVEAGTPAELLATDGLFAAWTAMEEAGWDWELGGGE